MGFGATKKFKFGDPDKGWTQPGFKKHPTGKTTPAPGLTKINLAAPKGSTGPTGGIVQQVPHPIRETELD